MSHETFIRGPAPCHGSTAGPRLPMYRRCRSVSETQQALLRLCSLAGLDARRSVCIAAVGSASAASPSRRRHDVRQPDRPAQPQLQSDEEPSGSSFPVVPGSTKGGVSALNQRADTAASTSTSTGPASTSTLPSPAPALYAASAAVPDLDQLGALLPNISLDDIFAGKPLPVDPSSGSGDGSVTNAQPGGGSGDGTSSSSRRSHLSGLGRRALRPWERAAAVAAPADRGTCQPPTPEAALQGATEAAQPSLPVTVSAAQERPPPVSGLAGAGASAAGAAGGAAAAVAAPGIRTSDTSWETATRGRAASADAAVRDSQAETLASGDPARTAFAASPPASLSASVVQSLGGQDTSLTKPTTSPVGRRPSAALGLPQTRGVPGPATESTAAPRADGSASSRDLGPEPSDLPSIPQLSRLASARGPSTVTKEATETAGTAAGGAAEGAGAGGGSGAGPPTAFGAPVARTPALDPAAAVGEPGAAGPTHLLPKPVQRPGRKQVPAAAGLPAGSAGTVLSWTSDTSTAGDLPLANSNAAADSRQTALHTGELQFALPGGPLAARVPSPPSAAGPAAASLEEGPVVRSTRAPRSERVRSQEWRAAVEAVEATSAATAAAAGSACSSMAHGVEAWEYSPQEGFFRSKGPTQRPGGWTAGTGLRAWGREDSGQAWRQTWQERASAASEADGAVHSWSPEQVSEPRGILVLHEEPLRSALEAAATAAAAALPSREDLPPTVDRRTWRLHAAVLFPEVYDADWHGCLFNFLFELWLEVGRAHVIAGSRGSGSPHTGSAVAATGRDRLLLTTDAEVTAAVATAVGVPPAPPPAPARVQRAAQLVEDAYCFAGRCFSSPDFAVSSALVVSVLDCLDDHDVLMDRLSARLPQVLVQRLLVPLAPRFQPEWVVEAWLDAVRDAYPDYAPVSKVPSRWQQLVDRLEATQVVHPGAGLGVLHAVLDFEEEAVAQEAVRGVQEVRQRRRGQPQEQREPRRTGERESAAAPRRQRRRAATPEPAPAPNSRSPPESESDPDPDPGTTGSNLAAVPVGGSGRGGAGADAGDGPSKGGMAGSSEGSGQRRRRASRSTGTRAEAAAAAPSDVPQPPQKEEEQQPQPQPQRRRGRRKAAGGVAAGEAA